MKAKIKKVLTWLSSPFAIGFYLTILITGLTIPYYSLSSNRTVGRNDWVEILQILHQKSIDYRLLFRGPRPVSPNLALLTVDERAVAAIGRWPWPRAVITKATENAFKYGAKVVAFDISFAEPSQNPADQVLSALHTKGQNELDSALKGIAPDLDMDHGLGRAFAKNSSQVVAGSFFRETESASRPPETEFCHDLIFKRTPEAKQWDKEEVLLSVVDPYQPYIPSALIDAVQTLIDDKEKDVRKTLGKPNSKSEAIIQNGMVDDQLHAMCNSLWEDYGDQIESIWKDSILPKEDPNQFKFADFKSWLENHRANSKRNSVVEAKGWALNTPVVAEGTKHTGFFNTEQDADGTIRSKILIVRSGNSYMPSIALKAFLVANNYNASPKLDYLVTSNQKEITELNITNNDTGDQVQTIPVDGQGRQLINYAGPQKMFPYMSFADLISDSPDALVEQMVLNPKNNRWELKASRVKKAEFIKDKIFVAGATAIGIYDLRVTPFEKNYPGAETHLNAIDNMIKKNSFVAPASEALDMPKALLVIGILLSVSLAYLGAIPGLLLTISFLGGMTLIDMYYFFGQGTVISIIWPFFLILTIYVSMTFYRYLTEERGKKELRQTFQKYVSPAIVNEILAHPKNIELGGKKMNVTVSFSDVRGFTTISEKLDPHALSELLNSYLTPMTEIVFKNQGTLDKYMGDAIMSFFGAPISYKDHAKLACRCALQSVEKLFELQKIYESKGLPKIDLGIGLNTGDVSVGNMGSQTVRSYTVMGDAVNLASRLEGINKQYGTRIILSEMTYKEVKDNFVCREVDWVRVKGKILPVKIYELIAEEKVSSAKVAEMLKWFDEGYHHYHAKAWQAGMDSFSKALHLNPEDPVSKLYLERCQDYLNEPPDDSWDGVFVMKTK